MVIGEICLLEYVLPDVAFLANHKGKNSVTSRNTYVFTVGPLNKDIVFNTD